MRCRAYAATRLSQSMASYLDRAGSAFKALREPQNLNTSKVMRGPPPTRDETMRSTSPAPGRPITFSSEADTGSREKNTLKQQPSASTPIQFNAPAESPGRFTGCDQYPLQSVRVSAPRASAYAYGAVIATKPARSFWRGSTDVIAGRMQVTPYPALPKSTRPARAGFPADRFRYACASSLPANNAAMVSDAINALASSGLPTTCSSTSAKASSSGIPPPISPRVMTFSTSVAE